MKQVVVVTALFVAGLFLLFYLMSVPHTNSLSHNTVTIGTSTIMVEIADTDAARTQGLSGRTSLEEGSGMLFVFSHPGTYGFWMKDMNFSLDIIFADATQKIITVDQNVSPESYRTNPPQVFYPSSPIQYVLEVPAGFTQARGITENMILKVEKAKTPR